MPKIGQYKYPNRGLMKTLLEVEKAYTALTKGISVNGLATALGVKVSGAFSHKVADMKMFGLVEGRGVLKLTELTDRILHGYGEDERRRAREEAWLNVDGIKLVHVLFKGTVPEREEEYLAILAEKSGETSRADLPIKARKLLRLYNEALSDILVGTVPEEVETALPSTVTVVRPSGEGLAPIEIKAGSFYQRLPYTVEGINIALEFLKLLQKQIKEQENARGG